MNLEMNHHHRDQREVQTKCNTTKSRKCTSTQFDTLSISELVRKCVWHRKAEATTIIVKRHSRWTETLRGYRWIACSLVQKEHSWMNREARATVLMVICKDDGNLSATEVRSKTDEYGVEMVLRFLSTYESVEIKTDGEPSIVEICSKGTSSDETKQRLWHRPSVGGHQEIGAVERANGTVQAQLRAYYLDVQDRMKVQNYSRYTVVSMDVAAFCLDGGVRYQSDLKERNRLRMREQEVVDTKQRWHQFEKWSWRRLQDADKMRAGKLGQCLG